MLRWISDLVGALDYWGVAILMAIETIVIPIPFELIVPPADSRPRAAAIESFYCAK